MCSEKVLRFEDLAEFQHDAFVSALENHLRRDMSKVLSRTYNGDGKHLAKEACIPLSHARRLLCEEVGGSLPLLSIIKAAVYLGYSVHLKFIQ